MPGVTHISQSLLCINICMYVGLVCVRARCYQRDLVTCVCVRVVAAGGTRRGNLDMCL